MTEERTKVRAIAYGLGLGLGTALIVGIPTDVIPNPWFTRMVPTRPQDYALLAATALLAALLGATYAVPTSCRLQEGKWAGGGLLSFLAVGCPICNKVVLALLGTSGALTYFEPIQPVLGGLALLLLGLALWIRMRAIGVIRPELVRIRNTSGDRAASRRK